MHARKNQFPDYRYGALCTAIHFNGKTYEVLAHAMKTNKGEMIIRMNNHSDLQAWFTDFWQPKLKN
jgi:hypothetical protein